ncbi:MAG TPA: hypothetical protein VN851_14925 [Thermoanaerobaculia bacterium]|nr:hypothetical protein [Thermoanaerobaculia bacterium]
MIRTVAEQLDFVTTKKGLAEAQVLAEALQAGIGLLYEESLIESYLSGDLLRAQLVQELDAARVDEIDAQRDAIDRDFAWAAESR